MGNGQSLDLSNFYRDEINNLDLGLRGGTTDYIDFIQYNEVIYPLMKGIDMFGRHFVVIKFKLKFNFSNVNISEIRYKKPILDSKILLYLCKPFFKDTLHNVPNLLEDYGWAVGMLQKIY